jgi:hypothetical protein
VAVFVQLSSQKLITKTATKTESRKIFWSVFDTIFDLIIEQKLPQKLKVVSFFAVFTAATLLGGMSATPSKKQNLMKDLLSGQILTKLQISQSSPLSKLVDSLTALLRKAGNKIRFHVIFLKGNPAVPNSMIYDDNRTQIVFDATTKKAGFNGLRGRLNATEKELLKIMQQLKTQIQEAVEGVGGARGREVALLSLLRSIPGGEDQAIHIDYVSKGEDRVLLGFIPLVGQATIGINHTAHRWYLETRDYRFFHIPAEKCSITVEKLDNKAINFMWADVPHYGTAYHELNYRLHIAFTQPSNPLPSNPTYLMCTPPSWDSFHSEQLNSSVVDTCLKEMTKKQLSVLEAARLAAQGDLD